MTQKPTPRDQVDLYLCLLASVGLGVEAMLAATGWTGAYPWLRFVLSPFGLGLLVVPGYCVAVLAGVDRLGVAALAGTAVALSVALLALVGSASLVLARQFSVPLLEFLMAALGLALGGAALWREQRRSEPAVPASSRWPALAIVVVPLAIATLALSDLMPVSPATRYTEFYVVTSEPALILAVVNAEGRPQTYVIVAQSTGGQARSIPIHLEPGERWEGPVGMPPRADGKVRLELYREGDSDPYRELWSGFSR